MQHVKKQTLAMMFLLAVVFFNLTAVIHAQERGPKNGDKNPQLQGTIEDRLKTQEQEKTPQQENVHAQQQENLGRVAQVHGNRLRKRFNVYHNRLAKIIEKLEDRIAVTKEQGRDTTDAEAKVAQAKTQLEQARTQSESSVEAFLNVETADYATQREQAHQARDIAKQARQDYLETLALLKEAVQLLRTAQ